MVQLSKIEAQLTRLGVKKTFFCRPEIHQLQHILMDHEQILRFVQGRYSGGFAIMVATETRLLLIDKKPLYLTVEDIRYDMISEVDVSASIFDATIRIFTVNKQLSFSAFRQRQLRDLVAYIQRRVMEIRQYQHELSSPQSMPGGTWVQAQTVPQAAITATTNQVEVHTPHVPAPIQGVITRGLDHVPHHLPHAVGSAATKLASRWHNPNPYTKEPLVVRRQWTSLSPTLEEPEIIN